MLPPRQQHEEINEAAANPPIERMMPDVTQQPEIDLLNLSQNASARNLVPKEPSFDLLGSFEAAEAQSNNRMPDLLSDSQTKPPGLDEIFGSFSRSAAAASTNSASSVMPDLNNIGLDFNAFGGNNENRNAPRPQNNQQFDPFGNAAFVGNVDVLQPTSRDTSPQQSQQPSFPAASNNNRDPFADIANLASGLNLNWKAQQGGPSAPRATPGVSPNTTQYSSPTHQPATGFGSSGTSPMHQAKSPMNGQPPRPDYSRSNFDVKSKQNGTTSAAAGTTPSAGPAGAAGGGDIFADILGQQGYSFAAKPNQGPRSINEMRKEEMVKDMDPDKLKILEWVRNRNVSHSLDSKLINMFPLAD